MLSDEEIERLEEHRRLHGGIFTRDYEQDADFENLDVETDGTKYKFSYNGFETGYQPHSDPDRLFSEVLRGMAGEDQSLDEVIYNTDYCQSSRSDVRRKLDGFTDESGFLIEGLKDDFSLLAQKLGE